MRLRCYEMVFASESGVRLSAGTRSASERIPPPGVWDQHATTSSTWKARRARRSGLSSSTRLQKKRESSSTGREAQNCPKRRLHPAPHLFNPQRTSTHASTIGLSKGPRCRGQTPARSRVSHRFGSTETQSRRAYLSGDFAAQAKRWGWVARRGILWHGDLPWPFR